MNETPPIIRTTSPTVDSKTFRDFVRGNERPNVWTLNILLSQDLSTAMDHLRLNMDVSFGVGQNNTLYIIDDSNPNGPVMSYYNLPLTISYNEYSREVSVCEYFSKYKFSELDTLVKLELEKFNINAADEMELLADGSTEFTNPSAQFLKQFYESDQPYSDLTSWIQGQKESTGTHEFFDTCNSIWTRVTFNYKSPSPITYTDF